MTRAGGRVSVEEAATRGTGSNAGPPSCALRSVAVADDRSRFRGVRRAHTAAPWQTHEYGGVRHPQGLFQPPGGSGGSPLEPMVAINGSPWITV
jgi:hypothetical protein